MTEVRLLQMIQDSALYRSSDCDIAVTRRPVVIYCGQSECITALQEFIKYFRKRPDYLCIHGNEDRIFVDDQVDEVKILRRSDLKGRPDLLVWLYGKGERAKAVKLAQSGVRDFVFSADPQYSDFRYSPSFFTKNRDDLNALFDTLEDDESRLTLASVIKQRIRGEHGFLRIARYPEYNHPVVRAVVGDYVVDAGAFDGRTSLNFALQSQHGKILAFEPDPSNQVRIQELLHSKKLSVKNKSAAARIEVLPYALFDLEKKIKFSGGKKGSSMISDSGVGSVEVSAIPLDSYVEQHDIKQIDLISIDVEGAESNVLRGMQRTLVRFRPKLQLSIYHKMNHLMELPKLARELCENYVWFMGHHNSYSTETDLYGIAREKYY